MRGRVNDDHADRVYHSIDLFDRFIERDRSEWGLRWRTCDNRTLYISVNHFLLTGLGRLQSFTLPLPIHFSVSHNIAFRCNLDKSSPSTVPFKQTNVHVNSPDRIGRFNRPCFLRRMTKYLFYLPGPI